MKGSEKRTRILEFVRDFTAERGYAPTVREIQKACWISSTSMVGYHLCALERQGHIKRDVEVARGIKVSGLGRWAHAVPLLGVIAAGEPIPVPTEDTWQNVPIDVVEVPAQLLRRGINAYALRVKGTSMVDALVDDGDIVVLEQAGTAEDGQMVAAWLRDREEATLKKLYREPGRIRLQPANQAMAPIYVRPEEIEVQGRVIAVLRSLE